MQNGETEGAPRGDGLSLKKKNNGRTKLAVRGTLLVSEQR
jgi:hypothetical protein